jgi:lipopolysaccharide/colanic/teichoic acid biosynthesis glycosyltransferase
MRLVGPRPLAFPAMLKHHHPEEMYRFAVDPGITSLAIVSGRALLRNCDIIRYDLDYVEQQSILLDLKILLSTVKIVLLGRGAF